MQIDNTAASIETTRDLSLQLAAQDRFAASRANEIKPPPEPKQPRSDMKKEGSREADNEKKLLLERERRAESESLEEASEVSQLKYGIIQADLGKTIVRTNYRIAKNLVTRFFGQEIDVRRLQEAETRRAIDFAPLPSDTPISSAEKAFQAIKEEFVEQDRVRLEAKGSVKDSSGKTVAAEVLLNLSRDAYESSGLAEKVTAAGSAPVIEIDEPLDLSASQTFTFQIPGNPFPVEGQGELRLDLPSAAQDSRQFFIGRKDQVPVFGEQVRFLYEGRPISGSAYVSVTPGQLESQLV